ncbi:SAM complex subunit [Starmerella bacillaris]|uniref:SAM complex subunit n=1 Tax=Starmerella bacillaris TaxID=1247836 RepID=A0AAV5RJE7_STABA|nr:SAM complex subunit [Starmerella bacillaris]
MSQTEQVKKILDEHTSADGLINIKGVDIEGRATPRLLQAYLSPLLSGPLTAGDLAANIRKVQSSLYSLEVFKDVNLTLTQDGVIKILLPSVNKFVARVGTNVGQSEGSGYVKGICRNPFGYGEIISVDASHGTRTTSSHLLSASIPIPHPKFVGIRSEALLYSSHKLYDWASSSAHIRGATVKLQEVLQNAQNSRFSIGFETVLRTLSAKTASLSRSIRNEVGNSFKFSAFFNYQKTFGVYTQPYDFSNNGTLIKCQNEVAFPSSTFPFAKSTLQINNAFPLYKSITASINSKLGILLPLNKDGKTSILDRFNLGGPLDLRGFKLSHVGPHDEGDALGGELLAATGFSVYTPFKFKNAESCFRIHNFVTCGVLSPLKPTAVPLPSVSTGFGVVYASSAARIELSFALPIVARVDELVQKGLVFGVGLDFL